MSHEKVPNIIKPADTVPAIPAPNSEQRNTPKYAAGWEEEYWRTARSIHGDTVVDRVLSAQHAPEVQDTLPKKQTVFKNTQ